MPDTSNRTFVCSVLFLDIVEYSKKPVAEQLALKQRFNALLLDAMRHVATADRIVLDTGDGAAVSFLGNPEDCLFAAMALRDGIAAESPDLTPPLRIRVGINLGPVRLVKDINGQLNIIGDGINVAQRVMSFAEPGRILVSRSYYEVVSCLSQDFARLFQYEGTHTDKHVREHSVYTVMPGTPGLPLPAATPSAPASSAASGAGAAAPGGAVPAPRGKRRLWLAGAVALALVGGALVWRMGHKAAPAASPTAVAAAGDADAGTTAAPPAAPPEKKKVQEAKAPEPKVSVLLVILPWGEIYVDGQKKGVSPPLKNLAVTPGPHRIEIRNTTFTPYETTIDGATGGKLTIQHKF